MSPTATRQVKHTVDPREKANKTPKIYNGNCQSHDKGFRQLAFREDGPNYVLTPVPFLAGNGRPGQICTTQEIGDLTIRYEWSGTWEELTFLVYTAGPEHPPTPFKLYEERFMDVWRDIKRQHPWVEAFLERQHSKNTASIIPISVVPPSEYEANKKKATEAEVFMKRFGIKLPFDTDEIPIHNLQLKPGPPPPEGFKEYLPVNVRNVDGSEGRIERWYSSLGLGSMELNINPAIRQLPKNAEDEDLVIAQGKKGIPYSARTKTLIRVVVGAALADTGFFYGGSVHVYNLNWIDKSAPKQEKSQSTQTHSFGPPPHDEEEQDPRPLIVDEQDEENLPSEEELDVALAELDKEDEEQQRQPANPLA